MLEDAEGYLDELRTGISSLSAKVKEGTATDEEIAQLTAWEQTVKDIQDAAAQAAIDAAETAYNAWNEALNKSLEGATTDYEKFAILSDEMLKAASQLLTADGTTGEYLNQYITEVGGQLDEVQKSIETNLRETYKTDEQVTAEKLKNFENDLAYAKEILKDADLVSEIERQRDAFISENAQAFIEASSDYKTLFGDLENLSVQSYEEAMSRVRKSVEESTELTDEAKAAIIASLDEIGKEWKQALNEKNIEALEKKFDDLTDVLDGTVSLMQSLGASDSMIQMVQGVSEVVKGYKALKMAMEEAAAAGVAMSMSNAFTAIVTMITGLISALKSLGVNMLQIIDNSSVTALANSYDKLTEAISRSVGAQKKAKQQEAVQNLKDQKAELEREYAKEASKWGFSFTLLGKKIQILGPDQGVLDELNKQISGIESSILSLGDTMKEDWLQTDTMSFASELSNILTGTYDSYADMMGDVEKLTKKTLNNITKQWLQAKFLEKSIDEALTALYGGGGTPTSAAYEEFQRKINEASERFKEEMERMNLYFGEEEESTSNASTISKSITENTATWIKGLMMNGNVLLNDINNSIDFLNKYSEQTVNGVDELIVINRQIQANTAVLPGMAKSVSALKETVDKISTKIGLSRQYG
jgi:uncharacterized protein YdcH (DUF465 family)